MQGLRIISKQIPLIVNDLIQHKIDYSFEELLEPIKADLGNYYWILQDVSFKHQTADSTLFDEEKYQSMILKDYRDERDLILYQPQVINHFAKFIVNDWTNIYAITKFDYFAHYEDGKKSWLMCN